MSGMEAALASGLLKVASAKLVSLITNEIVSIMGVRKDLLELQDIHGEITSWLSALRGTSIENDPSLRWVTKLRNVAYDIDDLLDEVHLEAEKRKIESDADKHAIADCFCTKPKSFMFKCKVAHKIKAIRVAFAAIVKQRRDANTILNNLPVDHRPVGSRNMTTGELSLLGNVEESQIPTRDQEKGEIISKLLESNEGQNVWVVSIVGLGGSGKTTLAKHICHDNKIKEQFKDTIFWVHVSQEFVVEKLISKLFEAIIKQKSDLHAREHMLCEISEKLGGKKFLLVLDDAWQEDRHEWEQLMVHLKSGAPGSKILLTTRDRKVAGAVKSRDIFILEFLSEAESWSLFLKISDLAEEELDPEFIQIGKEVVKKCGGVPLAIKTLGGILLEKREISTWRAIRESDLWNVENIKDRVFASLKLSYIHLADELKQCFTSCSIFPKGYEINKDRLIAQWISQGLINPMNNEEQPEDIGSYYFDSLVKVGFLHDPSEHWISHKLVCKMHDLIHDLTQHILRDEVVTSLPNVVTTHCTHSRRYLSLTSGTEKIDWGLFHKVHALYISVGNPSISKPVKKICYLRSVILHYTIDAPFPLFFVKFEYLGYLEIRDLRCTEVPEAVSGCWNLQALLFIDCRGFMTLPDSIGRLKKLRTLELSKVTDLESLPQSIGDCQNLRCLQLFFCQKLREIPNSIGELKSLRVLQISYSPSVQQLPESFGELCNLQTINLAGCRSLKHLPSTFASRTLRTLRLSETRVTRLPEWVTSIDTLECIDLNECQELVELPNSIVNLKKLEVLNVLRCRKLCCMPSGFGQLTRLRRLGLFAVRCNGDGSRISELENLHMISGYMQITNLEHLKDPADAAKACLKRKTGIECLELVWSTSGMEKELVSEDMEQDLGVLNALEPPPQVRLLDIRGYRGPCLPHWMSEESGSCYWEGTILEKTSPCQFHCLRDLVLIKLPNLKHLRGLMELPSLKGFHLYEMPNLEVLWTTTSSSEIGDEELRVQHCFPVLSHLHIIDCPKLNVKPYFPPSLKFMYVKESNEQLLSPGSFFQPLPPPVTESSSSFSTYMVAPRFNHLRLEKMTGSSSGWECLRLLTALESLEIRCCGDLTQLPESMRSLTSLHKLKIDECPILATLPDWIGELRSLRELSVYGTPMIAGLPQSIVHLTSLVRLSIGGWGNLKQLPEAIQHLTSLNYLSLGECEALTMLPECIGQLSALRSLRISECSALQSLPRSIQRLTALKHLYISGCPGLTERYKEGVGDDWHLVSHIPHVKIWE